MMSPKVKCYQHLDYDMSRDQNLKKAFVVIAIEKFL